MTKQEVKIGNVVKARRTIPFITGPWHHERQLVAITGANQFYFEICCEDYDTVPYLHAVGDDIYVNNS